MDMEKRLPVALYLQTQVLTGFIYHLYEERLLDILNNVWVRRAEGRGERFLLLNDVTVEYPDGKKERLPTAYINKVTVQLAAALDGDLARGVGAKVAPKAYPFVQKSLVPVRLRTPAYALIGNMHCFREQRPWHVIEGKSMFIPVTNAKIRALTNGIYRAAVFVAVNREQILSLQEEENPLLQVQVST